MYIYFFLSPINILYMYNGISFDHFMIKPTYVLFCAFCDIPVD